jgi:hypothetical protein
MMLLLKLLNCENSNKRLSIKPCNQGSCYHTLSSTYQGKNRNSPKTIDGTAAYVIRWYFIAYIRGLSTPNSIPLP